jgi:hypothetical protein
VIRLFSVLLGVAAALAASLAAFALMQSVGPEDRTGEFGFGDAATRVPGGGSLMESRHFGLVVAALRRELGSDGAIESLELQPLEASASGRSGGVRKLVYIDASGRSRAIDGGELTPAAAVPVARLDAAAIDKLVAGARKQASAPVERITLAGGQREWTVRMTGGTPDTLIANLDGGGLRLQGEPNPEPVGASPDSMLRAANLKRVLDAAAKEGSRVTALDVRPDRVTLELEANGRTLALGYGYDAQLTSRDVRAKSGDDKAIPIRDLDPDAIERMARSAKRAVDSPGLADIQYVLLDAEGVITQRPELLMYRSTGAQPPYVVADLHGRGLTWPGRAS